MATKKTKKIRVKGYHVPSHTRTVKVKKKK
jgi:hypothetical protein